MLRADGSIRPERRIGEHGHAWCESPLEGSGMARASVSDEYQPRARSLDVRPHGHHVAGQLAAVDAAEVAKPYNQGRLFLPLIAQPDGASVDIEDPRCSERARIHLWFYSSPLAMQQRDPDLAGGRATIVHGEALSVLRSLPDGCTGLVYVDPPFNTGRPRKARLTRTVRDDGATRLGFAGRTYRTEVTPGDAYEDDFDDYIEWLRPRLVETHRILAPHGTLYFHIDPRESHYCKVLLDEVFGRRCFINEIVWAYDFGGRPRRRWPAKHDVILMYARDLARYHFDTTDVDRIPYMAPGLQSRDRRAAGKLPTDVWWQTIVPTSSRERTGYPTQKPSQLLRRIVTASSRPDDLVVDWCAGSGTTGDVAHRLLRRFLLVDSSAAAVAAMRRRLAGVEDLVVVKHAPGVRRQERSL